MNRLLSPCIHATTDSAVLLVRNSSITGALLNATFVAGTFFLTDYNTSPPMVSFRNEWVYKTEDGKPVHGYESSPPVDGVAFVAPNFVTHPVSRPYQPPS